MRPCIVYWHCQQCETGGRIVERSAADVIRVVLSAHRSCSLLCAGSVTDIEIVTVR